MIKDVQIAELRIAYHGAELRVVRYRTLRGEVPFVPLCVPTPPTVYLCSVTLCVCTCLISTLTLGLALL